MLHKLQKNYRLSIFVMMAEIITYLLSDEKWPFILNGDLSND